MIIKQKKFQNDIGRISLFVLMLFIMVIFISCGKVVEYKAEKELSVNDSSGIKTIYKGFGWGVGVKTIIVDSHKYVVVFSGKGVAICPAKED